MWMAAMQAATIETAITGAPPPPPPEYAWMLRTWLQCRECVRAVADCHAQQRELLEAAASVGVEDIAGAIRDQLVEDGYTLSHLAEASKRARRRGADIDPVIQDEINRILTALNLTLADVKVSEDGDTTTVQIVKSAVTTLTAVEEAVSAGERSGIVAAVSDGVVTVSAPSPPPPSPPPSSSPSPPPTPPSPPEPPPTMPPPSACSNPCRTNANGNQLTCLHWSDHLLKVACIYSAGSAPFTRRPFPFKAQGEPTFRRPHGAPEAS